MKHSNEYVAKIGLGSVQFGIPYGISNPLGQTPPDQVSLILNHAKKIGINLIDTAFAYGDAEKVLGENNLASFNIVSKFAGDSPLTQLDLTLTRLKVKSLYGYLSHSPKDIIQYPTRWRDLQKAKDTGRINKIGFSLNEPGEFYVLKMKGYKPDLIQVPFNILDRRFEDIMKELYQGGCEIHSRSTFLQGLFFVETDTLPKFFDEVKPILNDLKKRAKNLSSVLLKFVLSQEFIHKVIMGINNTKQLETNLENLVSSIVLPTEVYSISENILMPSKWPKV